VPDVRPPVFADRATAAVSAATAAGLVALVASDLLTRPAEGDRVADAGTGPAVACAIAASVACSAATLLGGGRRTLSRRQPSFRAGVSLTWAGMALNRWGRRTLGPAYRPVVTVLDDHEVVVRGPYRIVRHPMYAGTTVLCLGLGATVGSWPASLAWVLPPLALLRRIRVEEEVLSRSLGARYEAYAGGRARLVPGVW
jgi:protein-S-isoprenylcysteine O-methyltransferase Ste14